MEIDWMYAWLLLAMLLIFVEFAVGTLVLLSFGLAALVVAAVVGLLPEIGLPAQLGAYAVANLIIVPFAIKVLRPRFSPEATHYGTAGTGAQDGLNYLTRVRDFDSATCISIDNDLYRAQLEDGRAPDLDTQVTLLRFEGTVAIVQPVSPTH